VDKILIINTIAFIDNRTSYLTKLYQSLRDSGEIMIVDFKMDDLPIEAPSKNNRLFTMNIIADLEKSGFKEIEVDEILLDYQYIVKGRKLSN